MRALFVAIAALAGACSPPATTSEAPAEVEAPAAPNAATQAALDVLTPIISTEVGKPVSLQPSTATIRDGWAYIDAEVLNADGSAIDWMTTNLASRYENGVMDEGGGVHALLKNENGTWTVLEHVIAPTDVAWIDWVDRHSVPADILGLPEN
jgi:hypothetical protein